MRLKFVVSITLVMVFGLVAAAGAAMMEFLPEFVAQCKKEAPLAQKDIDSFVKM